MFFLFFCLSLTFSDEVFWKKKDVYQKIIEKEVIVSASIKQKKKMERLRLVSAGHIAAPVAFVKKEILAFENYDKISEHFKNIKHQPKQKKLYIEIGAFNYYASLWIDYQLQDKSKEQKKLLWQVTRGGFKGLNGEVVLSKYKSNITEISMQAEMLDKKIPIPSALLKIGLEFIGKQMAQKMRSYIEKRYRTTDFFEE